MGAAREEFLRRSMVAGLASTVVISLTALTAGVAPAAAEPEIVATTTAQAPPQSGGSGGGGRGGGRGGQEEAPEAAPAATPEAPAVTQAPAVTEAPAVTQAPATQAPVAPEPVVTQAPVETPRATATPETAAPKPKPAPEATPQPAVEQPTTTSTKRPSTRVTTSPSAPTAEPEATPSSRPAPSSSAAPSPASSSASAEPAPSSEAPSSTDVPRTADEAPESSATPTETSAESSAETSAETSAEEGVSETSAVEQQAARVTETLKPEVLDAPVADVQLASSAKPVEVNPEPAKLEELAQLSSLVGVSNERDRLDEERRQLREDQRELREDQRELRDDQRELRDDQRELRAEQRDWDNRVRQWSPDWVQYDEFYRPMIVNPYRDPVRIVYEYENRPRVVTIPPLQRMVMYVADLAAYSFTAVVLNTVNTVVSTAVGVAVGSFFGGGFIPNIANIGNFAPPPPPPLFRYDDVPVQVRYSDAVYEPFRVQRIVDVGDDARYGERRVLLDGVTPAWGVWKQNAAGERQFEIHRTQQYPGLDTPREGPLPGDYRLRLASEEAPSSSGGGQTALIIAAVACAVLSLGAVGAAGLMGRRRQL